MPLEPALRSLSTPTLALALSLLMPLTVTAQTAGPDDEPPAASEAGPPGEAEAPDEPDAPLDGAEREDAAPANADPQPLEPVSLEAHVEPEAGEPEAGEPEADDDADDDDADDDDADADDAEPAAPADDEFGIRATAELGFLGVLAHDITLGSDGTPLSYPGDFNQSNLYLFLRVAAEFDIWRQHIITFVYQPIQLDSQVALARDVRIDGLDFPAGTNVNARYGFPFYRFGWAFDVLEAPSEELAFGVGLQIRNATIQFESDDGALYRSRQDVGPVPLLRARGRFELPTRFFFAFEVDGFYAFIPGINGSDNNVEGAILDASVRFGWRAFDHIDAFVNVRYIAGGAAGQGDPDPTNDGFQSNWLHFLTASLGVTLDSRR